MNVVVFSKQLGAAMAPFVADGIRFEIVERNDEGAAAALRDAHVLVSNRFDAELATRCPLLELLICPAAGTDMIDRTALRPGVEFFNAVGHEIPVSEYVIGALVALRQGFRAADAALREGNWIAGYFGEGSFVDELHGSTLGIIGYGHIGKALAVRAQAFGILCRALTLHPDKKYDTTLLPLGLGSLRESVDVDDLVSSADAVVIACELSPLTHALIDARRISLMRRHAVLVNVARGPIVDETALYFALRDRRIAGAALDVWYRYPEKRGVKAKPSAAPFWELENVLMTPHSSGWTMAAMQRKAEYFARRINEWARSRPNRP
jgi:phosphoglycerate dehydrogenase-like enzyme